MFHLIEKEKSSFRLILPKHEDFFKFDVIETYEISVKTKSDLLQKAIPTVSGIFELYETMADPSAYQEGVIATFKEEEDEYYKTLETLKDTPELFAAALNAYRGKGQYDELLYLDMMTVFNEYHICYAEIMRERFPNDMNVYYRNMPIKRVW